MEKNRDDIKNIMEKAVELIHQFTNDPYVQRIKERDKTTSMMEIVGVHRKEDRHSDFFKWLFDSSSDHQLGTLPADKLIKLIANLGYQQKKQNACNHCTLCYPHNNTLSLDELLHFLTASNTIVLSKAEREVSNVNGRPDIVLELEANNEPKRIRVVFENKVNAPETIDKDGIGQTKRYYQEYSQKNDGFKNVYIYNRCDESQLPQCRQFICMTYQHIVNDIIEPLLQLPDLNPRTEFILNDYILTLEKPAKVEKQMDKIIMAIGTDTKRLLKEFLENNLDIIATAIEVAAGEQGPDSENRQVILELKEAVQKYKNVKSKHKVEITAPKNIRKNYDSLGSAARAIIEELADKYNNEQRSPKSIEDFERFIHKNEFYGDNILFALQTRPLPSGSFPQYATITIADIKYRVRTDWYTDERPTQSFQKLLDTLRNDNELVPDLQVTVLKDGNQIYCTDGNVEI